MSVFQAFVLALDVFLVGALGLHVYHARARRKQRQLRDRLRALDLARGEMSRHTASVLIGSAIKEGRKR